MQIDHTYYMSLNGFEEGVGHETASVYQITYDRDAKNAFGMPKEINRVCLFAGVPLHKAFDMMEDLDPGYMWKYVAGTQLMEDEHVLIAGGLQDFDRNLAPPSIYDKDGNGFRCYFSFQEDYGWDGDYGVWDSSSLYL